MPQIEAASSSGVLRGHGDREIGAIGRVASEIEAGEGGGGVKWPAGTKNNARGRFFDSRRQGDD